jgi:hypothetical protein
VPRVEEPPAERRAGAVSAGLLPTDPVRRRIILVLGEAEMRLYKSRQDLRQILVSDGVAVLRPAPGLEKSEQGELERKLEKLGLLQSKAVLIQNPYRPDEYLNAGNDPEEAVARAKIQAFLHLCQLLGAARVTAKSVTETEDASSSTFDVSGGAIANIGPVNAAHSQKADSLEKLARKLSYTQENASGQADILAAWEFLRSHGLEWDQDFVYLVETVQAERNPVARLTVRMDTKAATDQIRSRLSKVNASLAQLEGSSRREFHGRAHFSFQAEVIFSKPDSPALPTHGGVQ